MAFEIEITEQAFSDLDDITAFIKQQAGLDAARKWFDRILAAIETLSEMPTRCALAPEADELGAEIRLLLYGKKRPYKIYFRVRRRTVQVFHIRHWARKPLTHDELDDLSTGL